MFDDEFLIMQMNLTEGALLRPLARLIDRGVQRQAHGISGSVQIRA